MSEVKPAKFGFGEFEFDPNRLALYLSGEPIRVEKKPLAVLAVLLRDANQLVPTQIIIDEVWGDSPHGVTPMHVSQTIVKLRKVLAKSDPETTYIETVKGLGYIFRPSVELLAKNGLSEVVKPDESESLTPSESDTSRFGFKQSQGFWRKGWVSGGVITAVVVFAIVTILVLRTFSSRNNESEVRSVVEESQRYESLVLYRDPESFKESDLDNYWTSETDATSNYDRQNIRTGVRKLIEDGRHYGPETKNEQFEFQSVEVNTNEDMAVVKTLEKWFIAEYRTDGSLIKNKTVGPYFVSYIVRKIDGRWLIEKSTTARATPLAPVLSAIDIVEEPTPGKQFFINLTGQNFIPQTVYLKVVGPGCLQGLPCTVPNGALRIHSELTENKLAHVPLTLASGEFTIMAQNGESLPSNSLTLTVP